MHPFEVMAEPIRRRIVEVLASGEHRAGLISDVVTFEFGVSRAAVSRHLRVLRDTGWVVVYADANLRYYALAPDSIKILSREARRLRRLWKHRIGWTTTNDAVLVAGVGDYGFSHRGLRGKAGRGFTHASHSPDRARLHGPAPMRSPDRNLEP